ncbi:MAG: glutamyl-tRNA reductase, partial [Gemmatimonadota bacterium]
EEVIRIRRNRPMFFIDMAVPRDIDPDANQIDNVYVYDIDDLNNVIETDIEERQREAARAEEIVAGEVRAFLRWLEVQQTTPTIVTLRRKYEEIKNAEVAKALAALGAEDPRTRRVVEALASAILNKVLHAPVTALKKDAGPLSPMELVAVVRELFDLRDPAGRDAPADGATKDEGGNIVEG